MNLVFEHPVIAAGRQIKLLRVDKSPCISNIFPKQLARNGSKVIIFLRVKPQS